jgi:hypothetical protein
MCPLVPLFFLQKSKAKMNKNLGFFFFAKREEQSFVWPRTTRDCLRSTTDKNGYIMRGSSVFSPGSPNDFLNPWIVQTINLVIRGE